MLQKTRTGGSGRDKWKESANTTNIADHPVSFAPTVVKSSSKLIELLWSLSSFAINESVKSSIPKSFNRMLSSVVLISVEPILSKLSAAFPVHSTALSLAVCSSVNPSRPCSESGIPAAAKPDHKYQLEKGAETNE